MIDNKNEIPRIGSLVNLKWEKSKQKGSPVVSQLEVVKMDIEYGEVNSPGGYKYIYGNL